MEKLTNDQVQKALREWLGPDAVIEVSRDAPKSRITGWIMHPAFKNVSHATRQAWLWDGSAQGALNKDWKGLRGVFREKSSQIGLILTYSPPEYQNAFSQSA